MSNESVDRRLALKLLGASLATATVTGSTAAPRAAPASEPSEPGLVAGQLLAPLTPGARLGRWRVLELLPLEAGAVSLLLEDARGRAFQLDICARDHASGSVRAPAESQHFEIFLANEGDGSTATHEEHGLAAMAVAELVRANEAQVPTVGFATLAQRIEARRSRRHVV